MYLFALSYKIKQFYFKQLDIAYFSKDKRFQLLLSIAYNTI